MITVKVFRLRLIKDWPWHENQQDERDTKIKRKWKQKRRTEIWRTHNMKSCSQLGWLPRTAIVVLFTFWTFRVTYVLNFSAWAQGIRNIITFTYSVSEILNLSIYLSTSWSTQIRLTQAVKSWMMLVHLPCGPSYLAFFTVNNKQRSNG